MASPGLTALEKAKICILENKNFIFQGGAGSGKTESLKNLLEYIANELPNKKVVCITHTNKAVEEIQKRILSDFSISTIHSFLNSFIKDYKKNIHAVIFDLFKLENLLTNDFEEYKKKYAELLRMLYVVKKQKMDKVIGKREYDRNPDHYISTINTSIDSLNTEMQSIIDSKDYNIITYNKTRFDNFNELSYGHDGLLQITSLLFKKYPLISKILQDKYDIIFIDEFQDTKKDIIEIFSDLPKQEKIVIGLFGDSMQSIYSDGVGFIDSTNLEKINKEDNYRCSQQVIDFINIIRTDDLEQEVALRENETTENRQGSAKLYYSIVESKPSPRADNEEKQYYIDKIESLITRINSDDSFTILKLTNKVIAYDAKYGMLFDIFNSRYISGADEIDKHLNYLQFDELNELCTAFTSSEYNFVLSKLKINGLGIKKLSDKNHIIESINQIISSELSAIETIEKAFELKLLLKSDSYVNYINRKEQFLKDLADDLQYKHFKALYQDGNNTFFRISPLINSEILPEFMQQDFDDLERKIKKEQFYLDFFSTDMKFVEIQNYYKYLEEKTPYVTMHKTKGTGIDNVLVVLDEYFWTQEYDFKTIYMKDSDEGKKQKNTNLFYVACSRAKKNLACLRLILKEEEAELKEKFGEFCEKLS